jgi:hypothetical protein
MFGFKLVITSTFPQNPPLPFLDEEPNPLLYDFFDYIKPGNFLEFAFLFDWRQNYGKNPPNFTLQRMLIHVNNLYMQQPPDVSQFSQEPSPPPIG